MVIKKHSKTHNHAIRNCYYSLDFLDAKLEGGLHKVFFHLEDIAVYFRLLVFRIGCFILNFRFTLELTRTKLKAMEITVKIIPIANACL